MPEHSGVYDTYSSDILCNFKDYLIISDPSGDQDGVTCGYLKLNESTGQYDIIYANKPDLKCHEVLGEPDATPDIGDSDEDYVKKIAEQYYQLYEEDSEEYGICEIYEV